MAVRRTAWLLLGILLLAGLGLWLRIVNISLKPLWLDEAYSAFAAAHDLRFLWTIVPQYETHPPVYYSMLHGWTSVVGDSLIALRSFGVIGGMLALGAVLAAGAALARLIRLDAASRLRLLLVALLLAALSPSLVEMSREVRPYPWLIFVYASSIACMFHIADGRERGRRIGWRVLLPYLASLLALLWLHNLGVIYAVTLTLSGVILLSPWHWSRAEWTKVILGHVVVAILWLPGLLILAQQSHGWIAKTWLTFDPTRIGNTILSLWSMQGMAALAIMLLLMVAGFVQNWLRRRSIRAASALLLCALLPPLIAALISYLVAPIFLPRTLTPVAVPAILLMALGAVGPWRRDGAMMRRLLLLAALVLAVNMAQSNYKNRHSPYWENWYEVADLLRARIRPGDEIWTYPNEAALPLGRALRDRGLDYVVRPLPVPVPALGVVGQHPTGSAATVLITRAELRAIASTPKARQIPTIWTIRAGSNAYDPDDDLPAVMKEQRDEIWHWYRRPIEIAGYRRKG